MMTVELMKRIVDENVDHPFTDLMTGMDSIREAQFENLLESNLAAFNKLEMAPIEVTFILVELLSYIADKWEAPNDATFIELVDMLLKSYKYVLEYSRELERGNQ